MAETASPAARATYPTAKLLWTFGLAGGALGGAVMALCLLLYMLLKGEPHSLETFPAMLVFFVACGVMGFGTVPALLCALWLRLWRAARNAWGLVHATVAGGLISAATTPVSYRLMEIGERVTVEMYVLMTLTGGLTALILASLTLPPTPQSCSE